MQTRLKLIAAFFLIIFIILSARLFFWQVIRGKDLSAQARDQYQTGKSIVAPRGNILASDSTWLAARGEAWLVYASLPDIKENPRKIADKLAPFFLEEESERTNLLLEVERIYSLLTKNEIVWVPIKHKISTEVKRNIEALGLEGIGFEIQETRIYPEASSAAHLLGFVGKDTEGEDIGYFGLEGYYNAPLSGKSGYLGRERDAMGLPIGIGDTTEVMAIAGVDLLTHIDKTIQLLLDEKLSEGIEKYGAVGGTAVVMNPQNGAILAMSAFPSYDPASYSEYGDEFFKNPIVSDSFEPGSIFKVLIMAAGLDSGAVEPDTKCEICDGPLKVDKYFIKTWNNEYNPDATMLDVIVLSDNVGMSYVGQKTGADTLYDYLDAFGIGKATDVDLQGEMAPKLREKGTWNIVDLATTSFGQGVVTTPMQMIRAVGAIANDGMLVTPQVVDRILGENWGEDIKPEINERVISAKTANEVTAMMVEAAKNGEAKWTHLRGFNVAGKTGTAQIPIAGHYDEERTIASFVGFAPADDPDFVMLMTLREPSSSPWASETAAPLWYTIAKDLFIYFGIQPEK
jgi:cell division protein FtsI/penicillin-binding protein 2